MNNIDRVNQDSVVLPQPDEIDKRDKSDAFGSYIMMFAGTYFPFPFIEIIASFIYYRYFRHKSRFTAFHAYQSLLGQIPISVINVLWVIWLIVFIVIQENASVQLSANPVLIGSFIASTVLVVALNIYYIVISIIAAVKASKGYFYYFPIVGKKAYNKFYGPNAVEVSEKISTSHVNVPPS